MVAERGVGRKGGCGRDCWEGKSEKQNEVLSGKKEEKRGRGKKKKGGTTLKRKEKGDILKQEVFERRGF